MNWHSIFFDNRDQNNCLLITTMQKYGELLKYFDNDPMHHLFQYDLKSRMKINFIIWRNYRRKNTNWLLKNENYDKYWAAVLYTPKKLKVGMWLHGSYSKYFWTQRKTWIFWKMGKSVISLSELLALTIIKNASFVLQLPHVIE